MRHNRRSLANVIQRLIAGAAVNVFALAASDALFDGLVMTTTGLVVAVVVLSLPEALDPVLALLGKRASGEDPGMAGFAYFGVVALTFLSPFILLPLAAALTPGLDFDGVGAWLGTAVIVIASGILAYTLLYRRTIRA